MSATDRRSVLADIDHALNEADAFARRVGVDPIPHEDQVLHAVASAAEVVAQAERYGEPLPATLRGAIAEFARLLENGVDEGTA